MIVIHSMGLTKMLRTLRGCHSILEDDRFMLDVNDSVWIIPGMFDALYND